MSTKKLEIENDSNVPLLQRDGLRTLLSHNIGLTSIEEEVGHSDAERRP